MSEPTPAVPPGVGDSTTGEPVPFRAGFAVLGPRVLAW